MISTGDTFSKHSNSVGEAVGFSLIEIIVTLVIAGIAAAMLVPFFMSSVTESSLPMDRLGTDMNLQAVMENMIQDYRTNFATNLAGLKTKVETSGAGYGSYVVVSSDMVKPNASNGFDVITNTDPAYGYYYRLTIRPNVAGVNTNLTYLFCRQ